MSAASTSNASRFSSLHRSPVDSRRSSKRLASAGVEIEPVTLPELDPFEIFETHWLVGAAARFNAVPELLRDRFDPGFMRAAKRGATISAATLAAGEARRCDFGQKMDQLLIRFDFLISPATPRTAFDANSDDLIDDDHPIWWELVGFTFPFNLSQQPACVIPMGHAQDGDCL